MKFKKQEKKFYKELPKPQMEMRLEKEFKSDGVKLNMKRRK